MRGREVEFDDPSADNQHKLIFFFYFQIHFCFRLDSQTSVNHLILSNKTMYNQCMAIYCIKMF